MVAVRWNRGPFVVGPVSVLCRDMQNLWMVFSSVVLTFCPWYIGQCASIWREVLFDIRFLPDADIVGHVKI